MEAYKIPFWLACMEECFHVYDDKA
jgi:hypothetical protein